MCFEAFHWCPDYEKAALEFARVLKPQGTLAFIWNLEDRFVALTPEIFSKLYGLLTTVILRIGLQRPGTSSKPMRQGLHNFVKVRPFLRQGMLVEDFL